MNYRLITLLLLSNFISHAQVDLSLDLQFHITFENAIEDLTNNTTISNFGDLMVIPDNQLDNSSKSLELSGINSFLELNNSQSFNAGSDFSFSFWFKAPENQTTLSTTANAIISKWILDNGDHDDKGYPFSLRIYNELSPNNGRLTFIEFDGLESNCNNVTQLISDKKFNDNQYHHVLFGKLDNKLKLYVDCNLIGEIESKSNCSISNNASIYIGARNESFSFNRPNNFSGIIDEIRVYNRFINEDELEFILQNTNVFNDETFSFCQGKSITINGEVFNTEGNYQQVLTSSLGCDSIINFTLNEIVDVHSNETYSFCQGQSIAINGEIFNTEGNYQQVLTSSLGCDSTLYIELIVEQNTHFIPNVFRANSINNNLFKPFFSNGNEEYDMRIYDRWGNEVFYAADKGWDGKLNSKYVEQGVYVYYIITKHKNCSKNPIIGKITFLK